MLAQQDNTIVTDPQLWNHQAKDLSNGIIQFDCSGQFRSFSPLDGHLAHSLQYFRVDIVVFYCGYLEVLSYNPGMEVDTKIRILYCSVEIVDIGKILKQKEN